MENGGTLTVESMHRDGAVRIKVSDTGTGNRTSESGQNL